MESQNNNQPSSTEQTGIVGSIVHMAETVVETAKERINQVTEMAEHLRENVAETAGVVSSSVMNQGAAVTESVTSTIHSVETAAEDMAHNLKEQVTGTILSAQEKIFGTTDNAEIKEEVKEKLAQTGTSAQINAADIKQSVQQSAQKAQSNISSQATNIQGNVSETVTSMSGKVNQTASHLKEAVVHTAEQVKEGIQSQVSQAQHTMGSLKETAEQKLEGAKEYVAASVPTSVPSMETMKKTAEQKFEGAKEFVAASVPTSVPSMETMKKTAEQKFEGAKEYVSEKVGIVQDKLPKVQQQKTSQSSEEIVDSIDNIPLPIEATLAAKDDVVVAESLPNFTEPSKEGVWEEVKSYHTIVQENKPQTQEEESSRVQEAAPEKTQPVKMVPVDESAVPQTEGNVWPMADKIKLSNETAWTNPQKTQQIVQSLVQETSDVVAEDRK